MPRHRDGIAVTGHVRHDQGGRGGACGEDSLCGRADGILPEVGDLVDVVSTRAIRQEQGVVMVFASVETLPEQIHPYGAAPPTLTKFHLFLDSLYV